MFVEAATASLVVVIALTDCCGRAGRSHPAASQLRGIENSEKPHSWQTFTSGEGVIGGWLNVRGVLRYSRISAGTTDIDADWHLGQIIGTPQGKKAGQ